MPKLNLYICRLYIHIMRKNISLFLFVLLSFVIRLSAQAQPVAHLSVDQSSILENGGSTKLVVTLRNTSGALANATSVTNATINFTGVAVNGTDYTISNSLNVLPSSILTTPVKLTSAFIASPPVIPTWTSISTDTG